ncbi:GNAT family N-acetyltransferase [Chryseomicrobium sp. FSL W7-1435]|uniref:GNAT family N-acetyltransferase n=1 Tax=Chryseomicrobium sp. FSL W7-1435 TaxID=2921704 RepID=UPI00315B0D41
MYSKKQYVFDRKKPRQAWVRTYHSSDFDELIQIQRESFPPPFPDELLWTREQLESHIRLYPEGALCVEVEGKLAGSITSLRINYTPEDPDHTWEEVTGGGDISPHQPNGNTLYVVDVCIRPEFRNLDLGKLLLQGLYERVIVDGLDRLLGGGRMSGYYRVAGELSPEEYIHRVLEGEIKDPVITFMMRSGRTPVRIVKEYLEDEESHNMAMLMEWKNPFKT